MEILTQQTNELAQQLQEYDRVIATLQARPDDQKVMIAQLQRERAAIAATMDKEKGQRR